jgi:hypothetical protein
VKPFYARQVEKIVASSPEESQQTEASGERAPKRQRRGKGKNR